MKIRLFILLIGFFLSHMAIAVTVSNLYRSEIILPDTKNEKVLLNRAFKMAAQEVLKKVSGQGGSVDRLANTTSLDQVNSWVAQHSIIELPDLMEINGENVIVKKVDVTFYEQSINQFLTANSLPIWGNNRPSILLWLVEDNGSGRLVSGARQPSEMLTLVSQRSSHYGLPIYAPLADSIDIDSISTSELWGFFDDSIRRVSERYQTDIVAVARLSLHESQFEGDVVLLFPKGESVSITLKAPSNDVLADTLNQKVAEVLSSKYAAVRENIEALVLKLQVSDINNYKDLNGVQTYLDKVALVRNWYLSSVKGKQAQFSLYIDGGEDKLINAIALDNVLAPNPLNALDPNANLVISYKYKGE